MLGMVHGTDLTNGAWRYPNGTRQEREAILRAHVEFTEGLLWFWLTDPVPTPVRDELGMDTARIVLRHTAPLAAAALRA